jgi:hypothetical protein
VKNGTETDIDCGGTCGPCGDTKGCALGKDCASGVCTGGKCQAATCTDVVRNGKETDVDCGGGVCAKCATGKGCGLASDCQSSVCLAGLCLAPLCTDGVKNGTETDIDCGGGTCGLCGDGKTCAVAKDCTSGVCAGGVCVDQTSCATILANNPGAPDGIYEIDVDGKGASPPFLAYCDMAGGGWTMVENQVPTDPLPDVTTTVNAASAGQLGASWRLGNPAITLIKPAVGWKLTDATNTVFLKPSCVVDWTIDYILVHVATDCTTGYTNTAFTTPVNGGWVYCSARGIGVNNSGQNCSMRADEGGNGQPGGQGAGPNGRAYSCHYSSTSERISLWFK